jgi:hypothetical protein
MWKSFPLFLGVGTREELPGSLGLAAYHRKMGINKLFRGRKKIKILSGVNKGINIEGE